MTIRGRWGRWGSGKNFYIQRRLAKEASQVEMKPFVKYEPPKDPPLRTVNLEEVLFPGGVEPSKLSCAEVAAAADKRSREVAGAFMTASLDPRGEAMHSHADYLDEIFKDPDRTITKFKTLMTDVDYDTLVGVGMSGALSIPMLARAVGKHFAIVRKARDYESNHSRRMIEGVVGRRWVFVDDLICTGNTRRVALAGIKLFSEHFDWNTVYVGDYFYQYPRFDPEGKPSW